MTMPTDNNDNKKEEDDDDNENNNKKDDKEEEDNNNNDKEEEECGSVVLWHLYCSRHKKESFARCSGILVFELLLLLEAMLSCKCGGIFCQKQKNLEEQSTCVVKVWLFWSLGCVTLLEAKKIKPWLMMVLAKFPRGHSKSNHGIGIGKVAKRGKELKEQSACGASNVAVLCCGIFCSSIQKRRKL